MTDQKGVQATTAKEYLSRARHLDGEIDDLMSKKQTAFDALTRVTQNYSTDGAQASKDPHKFDRYAELMAMLDNLTDQYFATMLEITETITKVEDERQRRVLTLYYTVKDNATGRPLTWEQVAVALHYSWKQTRRIHAKALQTVEEIINGCP